MSDKAVVIWCLSIAAVASVVLLVIGPLPPAGAATQASSEITNYKTIPICTSPAKRDVDCGMLRLYKSGPVRADGMRRAADAAERSGCVIGYLGWSSRDLGNIRHRYVSVPVLNKQSERRWHLFKIEC